jgi:flagellar protein FlaG
MMREIDSASANVNSLTSLNSYEHQAKEAQTKHQVDTAAKKQADNSDDSKDKELLIEEVKSNLEKLNSFIPVASTNLSFEFDENGDPPFIRVMDKDNKEVIREIPSEEFREVAKALEEFTDKLTGKGVIFNQTA